MDTNELAKELARLEEELARVAHLTRKNDAALAALDEQRAEYAGRLQLARQAGEDVTRRIEEKRAELQRAEIQAVIEDYERTVSERDSAAERVASAAGAAVTALREYEAAQEGVADGLKALRGRTAAREEQRNREAEPAIVAEALEPLVELVRKRLDADLDRDLIEAAARSPMGHDIKNLPTHLQGLARQRYRAILDARRNDRKVEDEPAR